MRRWRSLRDKLPDLLLLDLWMPILNGLEVLEYLARYPRSAPLKIVILSDQADADSRLEALASASPTTGQRTSRSVGSRTESSSSCGRWPQLPKKLSEEEAYRLTECGRRRFATKLLISNGLPSR